MKKIIAILVPIICLLLLFVIVLNTVILPTTFEIIPGVTHD